MTDEETIYADWGALRVVVPVALSVLVLAIVGFFGLRGLFGGSGGFGSPDPTLGATPVDTEPTTPEGKAELALDRFLDQLTAGNLVTTTFAFDEGTEAQADLEDVTARLGDYTITSSREPATLVDAANATSTVTHEWVLDDGLTFTSETKIDMVLIGTQWQVDWQPSALVDSLDPGDVLVRERVVAPRAPILGRNGVALVENRPVVEIGVVPRLSDDITGLTNQLGQLLQEDPEEMRARIQPSPSDSVVPIAVRRPETIASFRNQLQTLPGVVLNESSFPLPPDDRFGRALLGRSAEVTAEIIAESPDYFVAGDIAGRSGLQKEYNEQLSGRPGIQIAVRRKLAGATTPQNSEPETSVVEPSTTTPDGQDPEGTEGGGDGSTTVPAGGVDAEPLDPDVVYLEPPEQPTPLQLTIDAQVQSAAEGALALTGNPSAMVVVEVGTGHVLAAANGPAGSGNNLAMTGQYAPGSIFKVVSAYAALRNGIGPDTPIDCPQVLNVNGRDFRNAQGEVLGTVPFWFNFAQSCNTAFVNLANSLDSSAFSSNALALGVGDQYRLGTAGFGGSVPNPSGPVEKAATSFGQSRVLMSPLSAAVMAASVAGGAYHPPVLVVDPTQPPPAEQPLDPAAAETLRRMMRAVVEQGTGGAVGNVAGGPVSGKTGTAEYGNESPPRTHAWFVGFQNDLAFAVFVEDGGFGGSNAAPLASAFLNDLRNR